MDLPTLFSGIAGESGVKVSGEAEFLTAFELLTIDTGGWPHVAWLGPGEVVPVGSDHLVLGIWSGSSTRKNLESGRGVLQVVISGTVYRLRLDVVGIGEVTVGPGHIAAFIGTVSDVITDEVLYAEVLSGLTYRLHDRAAVIDRWGLQAECLADAANMWLAEQPSG